MKLQVRAFVVALTCLVALLAPINSYGASVASSNTDPTGLCTQTVTVATGVEVNKYSNDCVVLFKNTGTTVWTIPTGVTRIAALVIAGGGGGGFDVPGGGGAGGLLYFGSESPKTPNGDSLTVTAGTISVTVGGGGSGATSLTTPTGSDTTGRGLNGNDSSITLPSSTIYTAKGGGGGNSRNNPNTAQSGGSGGGGGYGSGTANNGGSGTGSGTTLQGYAGGKLASGTWGGGGGGGAGAVGTNWVDGDANAGAGGDGLQYSISGQALYYAGGGGGGSWNAKGGPGGNGGGGAGGSGDNSVAKCRTNCSTVLLAQTGNNGSANTGGGGGGSGWAGSNAPAGSGGSGIVIFRYTLNLVSTASATIASGNLTYNTTKNISVTTSSAGKVDFQVNGKYIPGCRNRVSNAGNSYIATCPYKPALHGQVTITATFRPSDNSFSNAVTNSIQSWVASRAGNR